MTDTDQRTSLVLPPSAEVARASADAEKRALEQKVGMLEGQNYRLEEAMRDIQLMVDVEGWKPLFGELSEITTGLSLETSHGIAKQLRELVIANPFISQGSMIRTALELGSGLEFHEFRADGTTRKALAKKVRDIIDDPFNQAAVFGFDAGERLAKAEFTDGTTFVAYDASRQRFSTFPITEITGDMRDADDSSNIIMVRRSWQINPNAGDTERNTRTRWYYTDTFDPAIGAKRKTVEYESRREQVDQSKVVVIKKANAQVGWAYGVADALAVLPWSRLYKDFLVGGYTMSRALAQIAYKVTAENAKGRQAAALAISKPSEGGNAATMSGGADLLPLSTAGKGYDFASGRPLAAAVAAGLHVSVDALLAGTGGDGLTSGAADLLTGPQQAAAEMRRQSRNDFYQRIFRLLGVKKVGLVWHDVTEVQLQRVLQSWTLLHNSGLFDPKIPQQGMAAAMGIPDPGDIPEGYLPPNNQASQQQPAGGTDPDDQSDTSLNPSAGTGQGRGGDGVGGLGNDHSSDME